jgi:hypothetical protein
MKASTSAIPVNAKRRAKRATQSPPASDRSTYLRKATG